MCSAPERGSVACCPCGFILRTPLDDELTHGLRTVVLERFSIVGMTAITAILAGGIVNAWARWNSLDALVASAWGEILLAKVVLFGALLAIAVVNRFVLMPRVPADDHVLERLARNVAVEQACGLVILAAAAMLGILAPPA